jgi:arylsulfatase A-like enzyme
LFPEGPWWTKGKTDIGISSEEETVAELLKERGYATACIGKWHLGHHRKFLPTRHGFDYYFGIPYSNDMRPENHETYPPLPLVEGEEAIEYDPDQSQLTRRYTEKAVEFIRENKDRPFFVYVPHTMAHVPLYVSERFKGKSEQGMYGDVMMELDWSAGEILSALKEAGVDERTLVIFTSDNGPWLSYGDHGGLAVPLREGKGTTWEGGMREPCIMRWPGQIPAGSVCDEMATAMDILPTFARLSGARLPRRKIDGEDIWELMAGEGGKKPHKPFYYYRYWELQAVRSGNWKLHVPHKYRTLAGRSGGTGGKGANYEEGEIGVALYDLESDVGERNDVAAENPQVVERMMKLAEKMRRELGDSITGVEGKKCRPPGKL